MLNGSMEKFSYESLALVIMKFILKNSSTFKKFYLHIAMEFMWAIYKIMGE